MILIQKYIIIQPRGVAMAKINLSPSSESIIPLRTTNDLQTYTGRSIFQFKFKHIQGNELVVTLYNKQMFSVLIPPNWDGIDLLESNIDVEIYSLDNSLLPRLLDDYAKYQLLESPNPDRLVVEWRRRIFIFLQHTPDQFYTVYSTIDEKNPYRILGYAPLLQKEKKHLSNKLIKVHPFMRKSILIP